MEKKLTDCERASEGVLSASHSPQLLLPREEKDFGYGWLVQTLLLIKFLIA